MQNRVSDEWETPSWLFDELHQEFNFNIDLCATPSNSKCEHFLKDIFLINNDVHFTALVCFMNPPYSHPKPFIEKAWQIAFEYKNTVVMILKCDTSTSWFGIFWDYEKHRPRENCEIRFLPRRLRFVRSDKKLDNAQFPSCIVIMRGMK